MKYIITIFLLIATFNIDAQKVPVPVILDIYDNHLDDTAYIIKKLSALDLTLLGNNQVRGITFIAKSDIKDSTYRDGFAVYPQQSHKIIMYWTESKKYSADWEAELIKNGWNKLGSNYDEGSQNTWFGKGNSAALIQAFNAKDKPAFKLGIRPLP
jgi:hypothetical protein